MIDDKYMRTWMPLVKNIYVKCVAITRKTISINYVVKQRKLCFFSTNIKYMYGT